MEREAQLNKATHKTILYLSHRRMFILKNLRANGSWWLVAASELQSAIRQGLSLGPFMTLGWRAMHHLRKICWLFTS